MRKGAVPVLIMRKRAMIVLRAAVAACLVGF
jgi:hypothetical protein